MRVNATIDDTEVSVHKGGEKPQPTAPASSETSSSAADEQTSSLSMAVGVAGLLVMFGLL